MEKKYKKITHADHIHDVICLYRPEYFAIRSIETVNNIFQKKGSAPKKADHRKYVQTQYYIPTALQHIQTLMTAYS